MEIHQNLIGRSARYTGDVQPSWRNFEFEIVCVIWVEEKGLRCYARAIKMGTIIFAPLIDFTVEGIETKKEIYR